MERGRSKDGGIQAGRPHQQASPLQDLLLCFLMRSVFLDSIAIVYVRSAPQLESALHSAAHNAGQRLGEMCAPRIVDDLFSSKRFLRQGLAA